MKNIEGMALLVMDLQQGIVDSNVSDGSKLKPLQQAIQAARQSQLPVIYVKVAFRQGYPEVSASNKAFAAISGHGGFTERDASTQIIPEVAPRQEDVIIVKRRFSAFAGSDLQEVLRAKDIRQLVLTGVSTSGVVLSTVREAADKDFDLIVLEDACFDTDEQVQKVLMEKVFPKQAAVIPVQEWQENLK